MHIISTQLDSGVIKGESDQRTVGGWSVVVEEKQGKLFKMIYLTGPAAVTIVKVYVYRWIGGCGYVMCVGDHGWLGEAVDYLCVDVR